MKTAIIAVLAIAGLILASIPWMKSQEDAKWQKFVTMNHCVAQPDGAFKCDNNVIARKP